MATTNFDIYLFKYKGDALVEELHLVHADVELGFWDWCEDFFEAVGNALINTLESNLILGALAAVVGYVVPTAGILLAVLDAKNSADQVGTLLNDVVSGSDKQCYDTKEVTIQESDDFDCAKVSFVASGGDPFSTVACVYVPPPVYELVPMKLGDHAWQMDAYFYPSALQESGIYPFVFGAQDCGEFYDVAGVCQLIVRWEKKVKPVCASLRSVNEHIDPPSPLRSLRETTAILDATSLRGCFEEIERCRAVQATPIRIYEQNMALMPSHLFELTAGDLAPIDTSTIGLPEGPVIFSLGNQYKGRDRQQAVNGLISYLRAEQPDIAGFCEFWMPEERAAVRDSLTDIYPYLDVSPNSFFLEGPLGSAPSPIKTFLDGGLMLLSRYPILTADQYIYQASFGEDAFSAKGILYAGIAIPGFPALVHVFLTHLQSCATEMEGALGESVVGVIANTGAGDMCKDKQRLYQVQELNAFIQSKAGAGPCILMGDFNINGFDPDLHGALMYNLNGAVDAWEDKLQSADYGVEAHWLGCGSPQTVPGNPQASPDPASRGKTKGGPSSFEPGEDDCFWGDPGRFHGGSRIDYVLGWPGRDVAPGTFVSFGRRRVIRLMLNQVQDATDHYGLRIDAESVRVRAW